MPTGNLARTPRDTRSRTASENCHEQTYRSRSPTRFTRNEEIPMLLKALDSFQKDRSSAPSRTSTSIEIDVAVDLQARQAHVVFLPEILHLGRPDHQANIGYIGKYPVTVLHLEGQSPQAVAIEIIVLVRSPHMQTGRLVEFIRQTAHLKAHGIQARFDARKRVASAGVGDGPRHEPLRKAVPILVHVELQANPFLRAVPLVLHTISVHIHPDRVSDACSMKPGTTGGD